MRYVTVENIREGMVLAKSLYTLKGLTLLSKGTEIKGGYIKAITDLGIPGIYIRDSISEEIEIEEFISDELRNETTAKIKNMFLNVESKNIGKSIDEMKALIKNVVSQIISNRTLTMNLIDLKNYDNYTYSHSVNVAVISIVLGTSMGLNEDQLNILGTAALLHDIGKIFVPMEVLEKPGKLTDEEFTVIKQHTVNGYKYLRDEYSLPLTMCSGAMFHHERYDGTGYPNGKSGQDIPLTGRIISIADVYDAIVSKRAYHEPILPSNAAEYIMANSGIHFEPKIVNTFLKKVAVYPIGTSVMLSNGLKGLVVGNYEDFVMRPKIKIIKKGKAIGRYIDLKNDPNTSTITIVKVNVNLDV